MLQDGLKRKNCQAKAPTLSLKISNCFQLIKSCVVGGHFWATTHPITYKHEGGVPQKNSRSKKGSEYSPLLVQQKKTQVDSEKKDME